MISSRMSSYGRERKKREKKGKKKGENIESLFCTPIIPNIMKALLLPRGCTPVTLTVEEPRKFCVLLIYSTAHNRQFYNTLSAREALVSVGSTTPQILFTYVAWNLTDKKIFSFHLKIFVLLIFLKQICICCCITVYHHLQKQNGTNSKSVENLIAMETASELQLADLGLKKISS